MDYEKIISNLQEVLLNQSRMLIDCQSRIQELEAIVGLNQKIPKEIVYGYMDEVENRRVIHSDLYAKNTEDHILLVSNNTNKIILFTNQLNQLKNLKSIEFKFDQKHKSKPIIYLANKLEDNRETENSISSDEFRTFCFQRGITVSFYDKNRGFYPDWSTIFS